jgi:hypothetical protein
LSASDSFFHSGHKCSYMLAYQVLHQQEEEQGLSSTDVDMKNIACPVNVEKILKKFKMHRCAMDFDNTFCKATVTKSE